MPDNKVAIVTTGSQGQPEAALARMADGTHRQIEIRSGDTIVLASTPIPGNEEEVARLINKLIRRPICSTRHWRTSTSRAMPARKSRS